MGWIRKHFEAITVVLIIFLAIFISKYPTLHNALNTPKELFFTKQVSWFDAWDINAYVSYIRYGQNHGVLLENSYTLDPHQGVFVFQTYTLLGVLNRYVHLDPFLMFHLASISVNILLVLAVYYVLKLVFREAFERLSALAIIVLGAGLGWIKNLYYAADFRLAGFTMVDPFERPHSGLTTLLVVIQVAFLGKYLSSQKLKYLIYSLLSAFLTYTIHPPVALFSIIVLVITFILFRKNINIRHYIAGFLCLSVCYLLYYLFILKPFIFNPGFKNTGEVFWWPDLPTYVLGFGLATVGIMSALISGQKSILIKLVGFTFIVQILLSMLPFSFHMYYVKGVFVWGIILAVYGFARFFRGRQLIIALLLLFLLSLPFRLGIFRQLMNADRQNPFYFLDSSEGLALKTMLSLSDSSKVLSLYRIGNFIPAFTDNKVYVSHRFLTPDFHKKLALAEKFYLTNDRDFQKELIIKNRLDYIYVGFEEEMLRKNNSLSSFMAPEFLNPIYENGLIKIYQAL